MRRRIFDTIFIKVFKLLNTSYYMPSNKPLKIVIFVQYKSGTTGLLYKIRNSLPENTTMINEHKIYIPNPEDDDHNILAKVIVGIVDGEEEADYKSFLDFDKKIYIVRDPRDWVVSGALFILQEAPSIYNNDNNIQQIIELLKKKENNPANISVVELLEFFMSFIPGQSIQILRDWMIEQYTWVFEFEDRLNDYFLIKYEDFVDNHLSGLEEYLGIELSGTDEIDIQDSHVIRTKSYGNWRNWFTDQDIEFFKPVFRDYMKRFGYDNNWELNGQQVILPVHCTEYVKKTINHKRERDREEREREEREQKAKQNKTYLGKLKRLINKVIR